MSTTIHFFNDNNRLITEQQALQLNKYSKHLIIDNVLKKEEIYWDSNLWGGTYYLSAGENVTDVLLGLNPALKWSIMSNKQLVNGYTIWECRFYHENLEQESKYTKIAFDNVGDKIATVSYDTLTHQPKGAFKVFKYGNQPIPWGDPGDLFPEDSEICFSFSDDGNVENIFMLYDLFTNNSYWTNLNNFLADAGDFFQEMGVSPEELYYYTHVEPLVPNF